MLRYSGNESGNKVSVPRGLIVALIILLFLIIFGPSLLFIWGESRDTGFPCSVRVSLDPAEIQGTSYSWQINFAWLAQGRSILAQDAAGEIYLVNPDETISEQHLGLAPIHGFWMTISPDNAQVAVSDFSENLRIYDLRTNQLEAEISDAYKPLWSPKGTWLAVGTPHDGREPGIIEIMNPLNTDERIPLVHDPDSPESWSHDETFLATTHVEGRRETVRVVEVDTGKVEALTIDEGCQSYPKWAPDENRLAYAANPEGNWDIFIWDAATNQVENITQTAERDEYQPEWSPDGRYLAFISTYGPGTTPFEQDLYIVDTETREFQQLTSTPAENESLPIWSPLGDRLAYISAIDHIWQLNLVNSDGRDRRRLAIIGRAE